MACIACNLCARACRDVQVNDVIGNGFSVAIIIARSSISTTPWRIRPVWPAANASPPCPPGALIAEIHRRCGFTQIGSRAVEREVDFCSCPYCGVGLSDLLQDPRRGDSPMSRGATAGQREPALRQGPLRLRLHQQSPAPDEAADPPRECPQGAQYRPGQRADPFSRDELGRGAGPCRRRLEQKNGPSAHGIHGGPGGGTPIAWFSVRPRGRTRRPISSEADPAGLSAPTMLITVHAAFATLLRSPPDGRGSAPVL